MTLDAWRESRYPTGLWRFRARRAIDDVVGLLAESAPEVLADHKELLVRVDAAYPFGERAHAPYKAWLSERKLFREALAGPPPLPSADEIGVCEVARDLVELGRIDEARRLVEEQAPNRHARRCPVCGVTEPGLACADLVARPPPGCVVRLIVPHHARLVGHADPGPLFEAR